MCLSITLCSHTPGGQLWSQTPALPAPIYLNQHHTQQTDLQEGNTETIPVVKDEREQRGGLLSCLRYNYLQFMQDQRKENFRTEDTQPIEYLFSTLTRMNGILYTRLVCW